MARFADAFSLHPDPAVAAGEAIGSILDQIPAPSTVVVMVSGDLTWHMADTIEAVDALLSPNVLLGLTARAVRAQGAALSQRGLALWATDAAGIQVVRLDGDPEDPDEFVFGAVGARSIRPDEQLLLWCDEASVDSDALLAWSPDTSLAAGFLTAASTGGFPRLFVGQDEFDDGAVGLVIPRAIGTVCLDRGVGQIGEHWAVTGLGEHGVTELAGEPVVAHCEALGLKRDDVVIGEVVVRPGGEEDFIEPLIGQAASVTDGLALGDLATLWRFDPLVFDEPLVNSVDWYEGSGVIGFGPIRHGLPAADLGNPDAAVACDRQIGTFGGERAIFVDAFGAALFR